MHHFTPESSQVECLSGLIECQAITAASDDCSFFRISRQGYVRLVKDHRKRILGVQLHYYDTVKRWTSEKKDPLLFEPQYTIEISKRDTMLQAKPNEKLTIRSRCSSAGYFYIVPKERANVSVLKEKIDELFATEATFNSIIAEEPKANSGVKKPSIIAPEDTINQPTVTSTKPIPITLPTNISTINEFRQQYQNQAAEKSFTSENKVANSPVIPKNHFYSTTKTLSTPTAATKRRHESIEGSDDNEENNNSVSGSTKQHRNLLGLAERTTNNNKPQNNFKLQNRNMNIMTNNNTHSKSNASSSRFNREDQENQENLDSISSPVKTWNRTFSGNNVKSCGKGFANLGNTCYMNAILQCLLNIDTFSIDLMRNYDLVKSLTKQNQVVNLSPETPDSQECNLYNCLCELITCQEATNDEQVKNECLLGIKNAISKEATRFSGYQQHVLDQLKDDVDKINKSKPSNNVATPLASSQLQLDNPIVDNFQFEVTHAIQCKKCSKVITKNEQYNNLCLEMPAAANSKPKDDLDLSISIQNALDKDFQTEYLNDFKCEQCASVQEVVIKRTLTKLPRILILYLKRYQCVEVPLPTAQQTPTTDTDIDQQLLADPFELLPTTDSTAPNQTVTDSNQTSKQAQKSFRLVKNDSPIEITHELTLKAHLNEQFERPRELKKSELGRLRSRSVDSDVHQQPQTTTTRSSRKRPQPPIQERFPPLIDISASPAKKTPLGKVDENKNRSAFSPMFSAKKKLADKLETATTATTTSGDHLDSKPLTVSGFIDKKKLEEMNEEEQLALAIKMSTETAKTRIESFPKYIDGQFDDDENENENGDKPTRDQPPPTFSSLIRNGISVASSTINKFLSPRGQEIARRSNLINNGTRSASATPALSSDRRPAPPPPPSRMVLVDDEDEEMRKALEESLRTHQEEINKKMIEKLSQEIEEPWPEKDLDKTPQKSSVYLSPKSSSKIVTHKKQPPAKPIDDANSYRIMGIVNHLGMSSNSGHYISDVLDLRSNNWLSYDDREVERLSECDVLSRRVKTGYIFFYIHK